MHSNTTAARAIGYARVSTGKQEFTGLGMDAQLKAIREIAILKGWQLVGINQDVASGKTTAKRPGLEAALASLTTGETSVLIVAKLDRLARSVVDGARIILRAQREGWDLVVCDLGLDTSTPIGAFGAHILLAAAELERAMIGERTRAAIAVARENGAQLGRKRGDYQLPADVRERIVQLRLTGISLRAVARQLTREGIPTTKPGRPWSAETVRQVVLQHLR